MLTAIALSSAASIAAPQGAARAAAPAFSYDDAVAALKRQSAQALDVHGGAPQSEVVSTRAAAAGGETPAAPSNPRFAEASNAAANDAETPNSPEAPRAALAAQASVSAPSAAPAPGLPAIAPITGTVASSPQSAPGVAAARESAARLKTEVVRAPAPPPASSQAVKQFAEILAQRLDNASQFDLRLDPPSLGVVEGALTLSDDGQAVLALSFDNQSTLDLFSRDEAALRAALGDAGFDLGGRNLQFSLREPARERARAADPSFFTHAPLHRGAVDIRA